MNISKISLRINCSVKPSVFDIGDTDDVLDNSHDVVKRKGKQIKVLLDRKTFLRSQEYIIQISGRWVSERATEELVTTFKAPYMRIPRTNFQKK